MPNGYSVGNLELDITALDKSATSLNNVIGRLQTMLKIVDRSAKAISTLQTAMSSISRLKFSGIDRFANALQKLSTVNTSGIKNIAKQIAPITELSAGVKSLGQFNNFANGLIKISKLDMSVFSSQITSLTASLKPFLAEITTATPALTAFANAMTAVKGKTSLLPNRKGGSTQNLAKTLNLAGVLGKIYFIRNYTKQLGQFMTGLVQSAIDYTETLNLWQVAMRGNIDTAEEFITKMNKAYGIAEQTLMKYQATFRNMLSTLGGVSTDVSYALSEYLTQMALDYASLYNTSIEKAMTVFQSVLSGQVRPIRSISGYDITETTIFQLYQQLGGTKTMRQLSQTEKRLLRIYAVFQQMDRSGAINDLNKTLGNASNQIRIMKEALTELGTWIGRLFIPTLEYVLPYLNAFLITAKNIAQAIVKSMPNYSEFDGTIKGYEETAEAMDEVQGKLLDFDKFRSLSGGEQELGIGIDEKLIAGLTQYQSILENVTNEATILAEQWTALFIDPKTGKFTKEAQDLGQAIKDISIFVGILIGYNLLAKVGGFTKTLFTLNLASKGFQSILVTGVVYAIIKAVEAFKEGDTWGGILAIAIGVTLVGAFVALKVAQNKATMATILHNTAVATGNPIMEAAALKTAKLAKGYGLLASGIAAATAGLALLLSNDDMGWGQKMISIFVALAAAITAAAIAMNAFEMNWAGAVGVAGLVAGGVLTVSSALGSLSVQKFKDGGLVEDGLFTMNKGEVMGTFDDGTSIVANNQQIISGIKQGVYQAVVSAMQNSGTSDDRPIDIYIDGEKVFQATKKNAKRHGLAFSKV